VGTAARKGDAMSDGKGSKKPRLPEFIAENWEVAETEVVLEEDGMRVIVELMPRTEEGAATKLEIFTKPF
jgi:hypothetical protein